MARSIETMNRGLRNPRSDAPQVALEVRSQRCAFAVLKGSTPLDWGVRNVRHGAPRRRAGIRRLMSLLQLYAPSVVIVRRTRQATDESSKHAAQMFGKLRKEISAR